MSPQMLPFGSHKSHNQLVPPWCLLCCMWSAMEHGGQCGPAGRMASGVQEHLCPGCRCVWQVAVSSDPALSCVVTVPAVSSGVCALVAVHLCAVHPLRAPRGVRSTASRLLQAGACICTLPSCYRKRLWPALHHHSLLGYPQHQGERLQGRAACSPAAGCEQSRLLFLFLCFNACTGLHPMLGHLEFLAYSTTTALAYHGQKALGSSLHTCIHTAKEQAIERKEGLLAYHSAPPRSWGTI